MRSRYSAHVRNLTEYLLDTWHASTRPSLLEPHPPGLRCLGLRRYIAHPSDVVARDLNRWLERNKHLAQDVTQHQRSPNPHDSRRR